jgi:sugar phosphate isomerase/epimerase
VPAIRLSCGDHSFPLLDHDLALDLIAELGFDGVNLTLWDGHAQLDSASIRRDIEGWAGRITERILARGLVLADLVALPVIDGADVPINHPDPAPRARTREFFLDALRLAALLEAPGLTIQPGIDWPDMTHGAAFDRSVSELRWRVDAAAATPVRLSIEPHVGSVCATANEVQRLCESVPGLSLTLDYTHLVAQGFDESGYDPLLRRARHLHARGAAPDHLQAQLAESTIDYGRIIDEMRAAEFAGFIAVEYWVDASADRGLDVLSETVLMRDQLRAALEN